MSIKKKARENHLTFTRADKGKTVIAIDSEEYIQKTETFLDPSKYKLLKSDPTEKFQKEIKSVVNDALSILDINSLYKYILMNPQPPKLYSLIKLHKNNLPIRPVVSFVNAPTARISKFLVNIIKEKCRFSPKYSLQNSYELISKIKNFRIPINPDRAELLFFFKFDLN